MLRALLLIVMALGFVGIGTVAWISMQPPAPSPEVATAVAPPPPVAPPSPRSLVLVAARPLRPGTLLRPEDVASVSILNEDVPSTARLDNRENRGTIQGALLRRGVREGDPILDQDIVLPGDRGYLAASLGPNMRAIPIAVDQISGAAGLIWPGDRVDVLLTQQLPREDSVLAARRTFGEIVVQDTKVIAVDQNLVQGAIGEGTDGFRPARVVTLEVTIPQAERLSVARRLGQLSLMLRPANDAAPDPANGGVPVEPSVTWAGDASAGLRQTQIAPGPAATIQMFLGVRPREEVRF